MSFSRGLDVSSLLDLSEDRTFPVPIVAERLLETKSLSDLWRLFALLREPRPVAEVSKDGETNV